MWHIYILRCADNTLYTGITTDIVRRLREHNGKGTRGAKYTHAKRPVKLVYIKSVKTRSVALKCEADVKKMSHAEKQILIA